MTAQIQQTIKRLFDISSSGAILALGWPAFLVLAAMVKRSSPGPILFVQERAGKGGRLFRMYKFRTMTVPQSAPKSLEWNAEEASRVTRVGHFLRDYGLDELLQVFNILKGDMSVIGPRPVLPEQAAAFSERERIMLRMKPGVLSLAAIKGRRSLSMEERYEYHVQYVERWSLKLDLEILLRAALVVLGRKDAVDRL